VFSSEEHESPSLYGDWLLSLIVTG